MLNLGFLNIHTFLPKFVISPSFLTQKSQTSEKGKQKENMLSQGLNLGKLGKRPTCYPKTKSTLYFKVIVIIDIRLI